MNHITLTILLLFANTATFSQTPIKLEQAKDYIGDSVLVCSKVFSARFLESSKNSPTLFNLGAPYPDQLLTVIFWGNTRKKFDVKIQEFYLSKDVCIKGRIELYNEKPQIVINDTVQIQIKQ